MKQAEIILYYPRNTEYEDTSGEIRQKVIDGWTIESAAAVSNVIVYILTLG